MDTSKTILRILHLRTLFSYIKTKNKCHQKTFSSYLARASKQVNSPSLRHEIRRKKASMRRESVIGGATNVFLAHLTAYFPNRFGQLGSDIMKYTDVFLQALVGRHRLQ